MSHDPSTLAADLSAALRFFETMFGHGALREFKIGVSRFPPEKGVHSWHDRPVEAAEHSVAQAAAGNVYFRTTPVREPPAKGRGKAGIAGALLGVHGDTDIADPVHKKTNLPPDRESALKIVALVGLKPTLVVDSGHGIQSHFLLKEPWVFDCEEDLARAAQLASRFQATLAAAAASVGGWDHDSVGDLARVLRVPGTLNMKAEPRPVTILEEGGPRYLLDDIESVLIDPHQTGEAAEPADEAAGPAPDTGTGLGFPGTDDQLLNAIRRSKHGPVFCAMHDNGDLSAYGGDASRADWHHAKILAFWCGPDADRIDRLVRRSKLMRAKWDEVHSADGRTFGRMTIEKVLGNRTVFFRPTPRLPTIFVSGRQLRAQTDEALAALDAVNKVPTIFQRGRDIVRVCTDATTGHSMICRVGLDEMVGLLTRSADYVTFVNDNAIGVVPPRSVARDILSLPKWRFPALAGIVERPRIRPDGSILQTPGYDPVTKLWLAEYGGWRSFRVPEHPTIAEVAQAMSLIDELLVDFPFVGAADRANAQALMLGAPLRPAIRGCVPVAAVDARSKQGTGKGLLVKVVSIPATGRVPMMTAVPEDEAEWRKSLGALVECGREIVVFDNATAMIESGYWANVVTADIFDDRLLGSTKRLVAPVRQVWVITGNGMAFGGDMVRRVYQILLDAGSERPEDRIGFKHELPAWAEQHSLDLLRAILVLARHWWSDGCPTPRVAPWGSFEEWTRVIGGILEHAGVSGFLDNRKVFREAADVDRGEWFAFVAGLATHFPGGKPFMSAEVAAALKSDPAFVETLPSRLREAWDKEKSFTTRLGTALHRQSGAIFGQFRLEAAGKDNHAKKALYRSVDLEPAGSAGSCG